jgi:hypothetical protein
MFVRQYMAVAFLATGALLAQDGAPDATAGAPAKPEAAAAQFTVFAGTKVPLSLINSISTKHSLEGDRVYLETAFPILSGGRIVIPVGSYVCGTVTHIKKPGRAKGRGELYIRFDSLTLPNGVTRDFRGRIGGMDGTNPGELDRSEGKVTADANKLGDARTVAETAGVGTSIGAIAGSAADHTMMGVGIGAAAGAAAGLVAILATRGPDAVLTKGSTVEMVLDRPLTFSEGELNFANAPPAHPQPAAAPAADPKKDSTLGRRRFPW